MPGGDYVESTWVNGTTPAINATNLNNIEDKIAELDSQLARSQVKSFKEYAKYFIDRSTKDIESFEDSSLFTKVGGADDALSNDYVNSFCHRCGVRSTATTSTVTYRGMYKNISSLDLLTYNSGGVASDPVILWMFFISDVTYVTKITLKLGDDNTDNYSYDATSLYTGWNMRHVNQSSFTTNGTPAGWDDITTIRCEWYSSGAASGAYIVFDIVYLGRPRIGDLSSPQPLVLDDGNGNWDIKVYELYNDFALFFDKAANKIGIQDCSRLNYINDLHAYCTKINFICKFEWVVKYEDELASMSWIYDGDNYIQIYIESGVAKLYAYEAASGTTLSVTLSDTLLKEQTVKVYFEKNALQVRAIFYFENMQPAYLEYETTITGAGCIYTGRETSTAFSLLTDMVLGHQQGLQTIEDNNQNKIKIKQIDESVTSSVTFQDDDELFLDIEPYAVYEIVLLAHFNSASSTPDIKATWTVSGDLAMLGMRTLLGQYTTTTSMVDSGHIRLTSYDNIAMTIPYGNDGTSSRNSPIHERFLIRAGAYGGRLQFQWAQNTSDATASIILAGSYIKATKFN